MPPPEVLRGIFTTAIAAPASTTPRARSGCALTQGDGHDGSAPGHEDHAGQLARLTWCQAPPGMSARRRSPRTRLLGCLADRRLHQAHLDTGTLTVAVAAGAGGITSTATDDDDKPNMLRAGSAVLDALVIGWYLCRWRAELVDLRSAPGPFSGWWLRSRGGHASRGTAGDTPRPGRTRTPG